MANDFLKNERFTNSQFEAVKNDYGNVLVSASAGSGKTKVLIGRIVNLLVEKKCKIKDLLVVTFTNAAADEMKARLKQELIKYNMLDELDDLNNADIFNLHKFCSKVIKEFFFEIGLDSSFGVLSENEADYLLADCVEKSIIERINDTEFQMLLESFNKDRNYLSFKKTVFKIHKFLGAVQDNTLWTHEVLNNSFELSDNNKALKFLNDYYTSKLQDLNKSIKSLKINCENYEKLYNACQEIENAIQKFFNKTFTQNFETLKCKFNFPIMRGKAKDEEEQFLRQKYSNIKKQVQTIIEAFGECCDFNTLDEVKFNLNQNKNKVLKLLDFVNFVNNKYSLLKQKFNNLDFSDLEQYALKILQNDNILEIIKERYKYIFVDEYQDTNSLQEKLLSLISKGDNLFMVGDVKQSIYGFRFCNPQIFIDKYKRFENSLSDTNFLINLNKNFRSQREILEFCNFIFSRIMTDETCALNYSSSSMFESGKDNLKSNKPLVNIAIFNEEKTEKEQAKGLYTLQEVDNQLDASLDNQIVYIANQIKILLGEQIYDDNLKAYRQIQFSDIAILSRNRSKTLARINQIFNKIKIPVNASYKTKLFESEHVNLILNYLKILDNFYQDIPLYSVLNSFIYGFTENDLSLIKLKETNCKFFYENIEYFYSKKTESLEEEAILNKLTKFYTDLSALKKIKERVSLIELLDEILFNFSVEEYYVQNEDTEGAQNIKLFYDFVKTSGFESVHELLFYIENFGQDKSFDKNITDSDNSVTLTTIHSSKGLEYPIVFLIDCGSKFSNSSLKENFVMDLDLGISTTFVDTQSHIMRDVPTTKGIKLKKKLFELQEEMRLLYVALTRPKNMLYLVGEIDLENVKEFESSTDILSQNSYYSWILGLLTPEQLYTLSTLKKLIINYNDCKFEFNVLEKIDIDMSVQENLIDINFNTKIIKDFLNYNPPISSNKLRYTVTEILNEEENEEKLNYVYKLPQKDVEIDYSKVGTIYHEIMQKLDLQNKTVLELKREIPCLVEEYNKNLNDLEKINEKQIENTLYSLVDIVDKNDKLYKEVGFHLYESANNLNLGTSQEKVAVQGVVDLIIEKENEIYVLDYKTSRLKHEKDFVAKYKKQLDLYAISVSKFFKKPVSKKIIYSFYLNRLIFVWQFAKISYT